MSTTPLTIRMLRSEECLEVQVGTGPVYTLRPRFRIYYHLVERVANEQLKSGKRVSALKVLKIIHDLTDLRNAMEEGYERREFGTVTKRGTFHTYWSQKFVDSNYHLWEVTDKGGNGIEEEEANRVLRIIFKHVGSTEKAAAYWLGNIATVQVLVDDTRGSTGASAQQATLTPHLDEQVLRRACKAQTQAALSHAGLADLTEYVPREGAWGQLQSFVKSDQTLFILVGESGCGKSWLMSSFAQKLDCLVLFVPGTMYRTEDIDPVGEALRLLDEFLAAQDEKANEWREALGDRKLSLLADLASEINSQVVVILDALDNYRNPPRALELICRAASTAQATKHRIKFLISCRNTVWESIAGEVVVPDHCLFLSKSSDAKRNLSAPAVPSSLRLGNFSESELKAAIQTYRRKYQFKGRILGNILELCASPLILRLVAQAYAGQTIPDDLALGKIFDAYVAYVLHSSPEGTDKFLIALASKMRELAASELKGEKVILSVAHYREDRLRHLERSGLLQKTKDSAIRFWHDRIHEFCLSLTLPTDDEEFFAQLDKIVNEADDSWDIEKAVLLHAATKDEGFQRRLFAALAQREDWTSSCLARDLLGIMSAEIAPPFDLIRILVDKLGKSAASCLGIIADRLGVDKFELVCRGIAADPTGGHFAEHYKRKPQEHAQSWFDARYYMASQLGSLLKRRPEYRRLARRWLSSANSRLQEVAYEALLGYSGGADKRAALEWVLSRRDRAALETQHVLAKTVHWIAQTDWSLGCELTWKFAASRSQPVRDALIYVLTQMLQEQSGPTLNLLRRLATSSTPTRREVAARVVGQSLGMVKNKSHVRLAWMLADDKSPGIRRSLAESLLETGILRGGCWHHAVEACPEDSFSLLTSILRRSTERAIATWRLRADEATVPCFARFADSPERNLQIFAANLDFWEYGREQADGVSRLVQSPFPSVRESILKKIRAHKNWPGLLDIVRPALQDKCSKVREAACQAIASFSESFPGEGRALLRKVMEDPDESVRLEAITSLFRTYDEWTKETEAIARDGISALNSGWCLSQLGMTLGDGLGSVPALGSLLEELAGQNCARAQHVAGVAAVWGLVDDSAGEQAGQNRALLDRCWERVMAAGHWKPKLPALICGSELIKVIAENAADKDLLARRRRFLEQMKEWIVRASRCPEWPVRIWAVECLWRLGKCSSELASLCVADLKSLATTRDWRVRFAVLVSGLGNVCPYALQAGATTLVAMAHECVDAGTAEHSEALRILDETYSLFQLVLDGRTRSAEINNAALKLMADFYCSSYAEMMEELEWEVDAGGNMVADQILQIHKLRPSDTDEILRRWRKSPSPSLRETAETCFVKLRKK